MTLVKEFNQTHQSFVSNILMLPVGAALGGFATASSSSLLDSSLLELSALVFAFLADGPFAASALLGGTFRFLASGDLGRIIMILKRKNLP